MTDICIIHPEYCEVGTQFTQAFGSSRTHKNKIRIEQPEVPPRRFGVRETEVPQRRFGVRETEVPQRRFGVRETEVPTRRFGVRETEVPQTFGKHTRVQTGDAPLGLQRWGRKTSKKLKQQREEFLKKLQVGTEEVVEDAAQHKYGNLAQASYDQSFKDKKAAYNRLSAASEYVPELGDFEIIDDPKLTNRDFTSFINRKTGEVVFSVRGSDANFWKPDANIDALMRGKMGRFQNLGDWNTNFKTAIGQAHNSVRYKQAELAYERLSQITGTPLNEIKPVGHSLGGGLSKHLAKKYGSKSVVFDPAEHPFLTPQGDEIHSGYGNQTYRTFGDGVSLGEVTKRGHPNSDVKNLTALPGTEADIMAHHDMEQMIRKPAKIGPNGELIQVRTTKLRNVSGLVGTNAVSKGLSTALMVAPSLAFEPEYANETEKAYRRGVDLPLDLAKYEVEMGGVSALGKIAGEGGIPVDYGGVMTQLLVQEFQDVPGYHKAMKSVREPIFGKDEDYRVEDFSPGVKFLQNIFNPSHSRQQRRDEELKIQEMADAYGISYEEAYLITPETDPGVPIKNLDTKEVIQDRLDDASLKGGYDPNAAHAPRIYLDQPIPLNRPKELKDILETNPYIATRPKLGKKINGKSVYNIWQRQKDEWDEQTIKEYWRAQSQTKHEFEYNRSFLRKQRRDMYGTTTRRTNEYAPPAETPRRQGVVEEPPPQPPTTTRRRIGGEL